MIWRMLAKSYEEIPQSEVAAGTDQVRTRPSQSSSWTKRRTIALVVMSLMVLALVLALTSSTSMGDVLRLNKNNQNKDDSPGTHVVDDEEEKWDDDDETVSGGAPDDYKEPIQDQTLEEDEETIQKSIEQQASMAGRCASNWSPEFTKKYMEECPYWLTTFDQWENALTKSSRIVGYLCDNVRDCRGWGDRTGGILNAFIKAIHDNSLFKVGHPGLQNLFLPCMFPSKRNNWAAPGVPEFKGHIGTCMTTSALQCYGWMGMSCPGGRPLATVNTDRVCISNSYCTGILKAARGKLLTAASVIGCPLRAILEPNLNLREGIKIPIRIGDEKSHIQQMTVKEAEKLFSAFYIISIHFRLGDFYAFYHGANAPANTMDINEERFLRPFHCAETVERYLLANKKTNGKPIKWFLASDSYRLKKMIAKSFGERVIIIDLPPEHVAIDEGPEALSQTVAEWHLLSMGDELIVNKIGTIAGDFFFGRVSAFAKTAWVYQLKHVVYDAGTCRKYSLPFEGIWEDLKGKTCQKESISSKSKDFYKQEHLELLTAKDVAFPQAYVSASTGDVVLVNSTFASKQSSDG